MLSTRINAQFVQKLVKKFYQKEIPNCFVLWVCQRCKSPLTYTEFSLVSLNIFILHRLRNKFLQLILISLDSASWELHQYSRRMCGPIRNLSSHILSIQPSLNFYYSKQNEAKRKINLSQKNAFSCKHMYVFSLIVWCRVHFFLIINIVAINATIAAFQEFF